MDQIVFILGSQWVFMLCKWQKSGTAKMCLFELMHFQNFIVYGRRECKCIWVAGVCDLMSVRNRCHVKLHCTHGGCVFEKGADDSKVHVTGDYENFRASDCSWVCKIVWYPLFFALWVDSNSSHATDLVAGVCACVFEMHLVFHSWVYVLKYVRLLNLWHPTSHVWSGLLVGTSSSDVAWYYSATLHHSHRL